MISGFYGLGNTGDEAILESMIDNLRDELDDVEITVFSLSPEKTASDHQVKSIYRGWRHQFFDKVKALKEADLLLSGGGGLLQDTYPTKIIFGPLPYYLLIVFLAKLCGTKVMFFSQGIGPVSTKYAKILMLLFANLADVITVRDQFSKDLLQKLKVTKPKTIVTADIVFAYKKKEDTRCLDSLPLKGTEKLVAISVRPWFEYTDHYKQLAKIADDLIVQAGVTPVFVPMEGHHDFTASEKVLEQMTHRDQCLILGPNFTPSQYLAFIGQCQLTIGLRLHALIFAAITGVPHIGISYDKKVESLLKRSGMWSFSSTLEEVNSEKLTENAIYLLHNRDKYHVMINKNVASLREAALENIKILKTYFL